ETSHGASTCLEKSKGGMNGMASGMALFVFCFQFAHEVGTQNMLDVFGVALRVVERQVDFVRQEQLPQAVVAVELARPIESPFGQKDDVAFDPGPAPAGERPCNMPGVAGRFLSKIGQ